MKSVRIYHNNKFISLVSSYDSRKIQNENIDNANSFVYKDTKQLEKLIDLFIENSSIKEIEIIGYEFESLLRDFMSLFFCIEAAGGLVFNENDELLVIYRFGKTDLPKGKIEHEENPKNAALREVSEECGINNMMIIREEPSTYHIYTIKGKRFLKKTYWFKMLYRGSEKLNPQIEEGITEVKWLSRSEIKDAQNKTYYSLKHFFEL